MEKIVGENNFIKDMISGLEKRIEEEINKRINEELSGKKFIEMKLNVLREEIRNDEKQILQGEQKFVQYIHESMASMNQIIRLNKEEQEVNLTGTQNLFTENMKTLSNTVEIVKESTATKIHLLERQLKETGYRINEVRQHFTDHVQMVNSQLDLQNDKITRTEDELRTFVTLQIKDLNIKRELQIKQQEEWEQELEKKNLQIFKEISKAMKGLKSEHLKERQETLDSL